MYKNKLVEDCLDEYKTLVMDLENLDIKVDKKDKVVILLNFLPKSLKNFKETLKYRREKIWIDDIQNALNAKLVDIKSNEKAGNLGEGLTVKGRSQKNDGKGNRGRSHTRLKSNGRKD